MEALSITEVKKEPRVSSEELAKSLKIQAKNALAMIDSNLKLFEDHGQLAFKTRVKSKKGSGQATRYALLNEDQCYFLLTLSRNNAHVKQLKSDLVKQFGRFRRNQQTAQDYIPFYPGQSRYVD